MKTRARWKKGLSASARLAYFRTKPQTINKWQIFRGRAKKELSSEAQLKLEWVIFYYTVGKQNAKYTACHFSISRKTLHKWLKRFNERNLRTLEEVSRAPLKGRGWQVSSQEEERIIKLRKKNMELGKSKLRRIYFR